MVLPQVTIREVPIPVASTMGLTRSRAMDLCYCIATPPQVTEGSDR